MTQKHGTIVTRKHGTIVTRKHGTIVTRKHGTIVTRRPHSSDRGDMAVEAAIVAPVLFFLMFAGLLVAGRSIQARNQAESAAQEAARAASLEQTQSAAVQAGQRALDSNISDTTGLTCSATIDAANLLPGSVVQVEVTCDTELVAGKSATFTASAFEIVDQYRQGEAP